MVTAVKLLQVTKVKCTVQFSQKREGLRKVGRNKNGIKKDEH